MKTTRRFLHLLAGSLMLLLLASCYYSHPNKMDHWKPADGESVDSVDFRIAHHYWKGFNFEVTDSLRLAPLPPAEDAASDGWILSDLLNKDSIVLGRHDKVVVADIRYVPSDDVDSVWVKVARDQLTQGWVREKTLMASIVADDGISKFIHAFSGRRTIILGSTAGVLVVLLVLATWWRRNRPHGVHHGGRLRGWRGIFSSAGLLAPGGWKGAFRSFYPTLQCLVIACSAALYGSIQHFVPGTWVEFYFHPTLNPLHAGLPLVMRAFLASVWLLLVVSIAVVIDLCRQEGWAKAVVHLAGMGCNCIILYLAFTLTVPLYVGYVLLPLYCAFALWRYRRLHKPVYYCGNCGEPMEHSGVCPKCGAVNL